MRSPSTVYLDECVNHKIVPYLRAWGITVRTTRDEAMSGASDDA